ncbi:hypothetical protein OV203_08155 [Nannocystis sp. ILAH1]|uniref:hypothetical protein n=1 Tax=unclassified Nannocystis TaxID=2627009 RepID=UPI002271EBA0|nr:MULTISPECIES: hypothetical protein [unclassified Nannocystis]MCY0987092.1 hypothetical protein [Nannocystis sp. ILAH1]MCY1071975.1 hypothetical protein [Nannocystis sp. RBIL2]
MSLAELGKLATGELGSLLKGITIGELLGQGGGAAAPASPRGRGAGKPVKVPQALAKAPEKAGRKGRGAAAPAKEAPAPAAKRGGGSKSVVDTRTPAGRDAYDQGMLSALKTAPGPQAAPDLSAVVGGTPLQVRTALARLIERGLVSWTGQARGTRYTAV